MSEEGQLYSIVLQNLLSPEYYNSNLLEKLPLRDSVVLILNNVVTAEKFSN
jgi:hypothetical protein